MTQSKHPSYLAYGVGKPVVSESLDGSVSFITERDLSLYYDTVSPEEYGKDSLRENLENLNWLETNVIAFNEQVNSLYGLTPILPIRFGSVYGSKRGMKEFLRANYDTFSRNLQYLEGKSEWGMKVYLSRSLFRKWLSLQAAEQVSPTDESKPGATFFQRKKHEYKLLEQEDEGLHAILNDIRGKVDSAVIDSKAVEFLHGFEKGRSSLKPVFHLAILIERKNTDTLSPLIEELKAKYKDKGLAFRLSGPWPPYNFVGLEE